MVVEEFEEITAKHERYAFGDQKEDFSTQVSPCVCYGVVTP
jgi:hypothetical protein